MSLFNYKGREFYCEKVSVSKVAQKVGTPFYLYSMGTFLDSFLKLKNAFKAINPLICFSTKANSNLTVLKALVNAGSGLDIVSGGELYRAKKVGAKPSKIVFASVGKTPEEIESAIRAKILLFNVESAQELEVINKIARRLKTTQKVAIRINPDVAAKTHRFITTGTKQNKFGIDMSTAFELFTNAKRYPFLKLTGVHLHIGSQITEAKPFVKAINRALDFIDRVHEQGGKIETLNIGGGLGIVYSKEKPQTAQEFAKAVVPLLKKRKLKIILEPGRFIAGNSGILVTRVLYQKKSPTKDFFIVDAAMNDLIRPSFYDAYHEIKPVLKGKDSTPSELVDIVGPICESGDFLAKNRKVPKLKVGDLLAVMSCGAYAFVMAGNYNSRPRVPEVVVKGSRFFVARRRETHGDLVRHETIVKEVV